jgi:hypothetical protein
MTAYLLVIGDREALAWILTEERMAFVSRAPTGAISELRQGDRLYLYSTRGCFKNPTRDRGRVMGEAQIETEVAALSSPIELAGREFHTGCSLAIKSLAAPHEGPELGALAHSMHLFRVPDRWSAYVRRTLVRLDNHDDRLLKQRLDRVAVSPSEVLDAYRRLAQVGKR